MCINLLPLTRSFDQRSARIKTVPNDGGEGMGEVCRCGQIGAGPDFVGIGLDKVSVPHFMEKIVHRHYY